MLTVVSYPRPALLVSPEHCLFKSPWKSGVIKSPHPTVATALRAHFSAAPLQKEIKVHPQLAVVPACTLLDSLLLRWLTVADVCCFVLLTRGWGRLETRPPVALGSSPELSAFTMSLAPLVHPSPIFLTDTENFRIQCNSMPRVSRL